jgi:hypothetical protein
MSGFLNISVLVLATMVLVLAGMVGYLYWQQNKLMRAMSSLSDFVKSQFTPPLVVESEPEPEAEPQAEPEAEDDDEDDSDEEDEEDEEDDRVSVNLIEKVTEEKVEVPQEDDFESKTAPQLRELLNKRGIPYGKRDSKSILLELLKASS